MSRFPAAAIAVLAAILLARPAGAQCVSFDNVSTGVIADVGIGTSAAGDQLLFEVGGESAGLRTLGCSHWLLQWDGLLAPRGGWLANAHPYTSLIGGRLQAYVEPGYRFGSGDWLPYAGARLAGDVSVMTEPGYSLSELAKINSVDGVGGVVADTALRLDGGVSFIRGDRSLLLVAFFQEAIVAPGYTAPGHAFSDFGGSARFDIERAWTLIFEGYWGLTPAISHAAFDSEDRTMNFEALFLARRIFRNSSWLSLQASVSQLSDHAWYATSSQSYDTTSALTWTFTVLFGFPLGPQR